jgi:DNA-binding beta-propeller fold protein YncE
MRASARRISLAALCALLSALALVVAPAQAAIHPFLGVIASTTPPETPGADPARFENACGVAVDDRGDVYLSDYDRHAVDLFTLDPIPKYLNKIAGVGPLDGPCELAVASDGDVYVNDWHQGVARYSPSSYPFVFGELPTYAAPVTIDSDTATGVAVDPATDRVYVAHRTYVAAYEPSGEPVLSGGEPLRIGLGSLGDGNGLAISGFAATSGYLYVADAGDDTVKVYDPAADPLDPVEVIDGSAAPQGHFNDLADSDLAVDDSDGHFFVLDTQQSNFAWPLAAVDEFGPSGSYVGQLPRPILSGRPSGIAVDNSSGANESPTAGNIYVTSQDPESPENAFLYGFGATAPVPTRLLHVAKQGSGKGTLVSAPACLGEFEKTQPVTLTASADPHSTFKGWSVGGDPAACPGTGPCQLTSGADLEVSAEFEALPQQALTVSKAGSGGGAVVSQPAGIECGSSCSTGFNAGSVVTLTADPQLHSAFTGWSVAGQPGACPGLGSCRLTMGSDTEVVASFESIPQQSLTVSTAGLGKGAVKSSPIGISCGAVCGAGFDRGSVVTLTAIPAAGSNFGGWSGAGCSGTGPCAVTLNADAAVSASFEPAEALPAPPLAFGGRILSIAVSGPGSGTIVSDPAGIDCGAPCAGAYPQGARVTLAASPGPESRFGGWSGCESANANRCTVTMDASRTISASFEEAAALELVASSAKGATAVLRVRVPGSGVLSASARYLKPAKAKAKGTGVVDLRLALNKRGRRALARQGALRLKIAVAFKPSDGGAAAALTKTVTFKQKGRSTG